MKRELHCQSCFNLLLTLGGWVENPCVREICIFEICLMKSEELHSSLVQVFSVSLRRV